MQTISFTVNDNVLYPTVMSNFKTCSSHHDGESQSNQPWALKALKKNKKKCKRTKRTER